MKTVFSDDTLREAREKLLARSTLLRGRIEEVKGDLHGNDDRSPHQDDAVTKREKAEVLQAIEKSSYAEMDRIEAALARMEEGSFGLCEECGQEIEPERFVAYQYATRCKKCAHD